VLLLDPSVAMRDFLRSAQLLLALLLCSTALPAQPLASAFVRLGDRVRVTTSATTSAGARRVGVVQRVTNDSITLDWTAGARETLPLHRVSRLEVSDGRGSFVGRGMGVGLLGGGAVGAVYGGVIASGGGDDVSPALVVAATTITGGLVGSAIGGLVGAVGRRERWTRVRLEQPLRGVSITPQAGPTHAGHARIGMHVGIRF